LGVLHRDLKPANVMLGPHGEVLVTDWGLAIPLPGPEGESLREQVPENLARSGSGTPVYMSPEQAREEELDARSDVYALGAILFELVELRRAVEAPTVAAILLKVSAGEVSTPTNASAPLAAVIRKAMALDRDARYGSATELAEDVETVLDGRTPVAEDASVLTQATRYYFSHDPAMSRLRVVDIDLWVGSTFFFGAAAAVGLARWISIDWWWLLLAGVVVAIPSTRRWLLLRKAAKKRDSSA
jgi:serine/threonine protein kinase